MFIKIYFDRKPLFLCDKIDSLIEPYVHHDDTMLIEGLDPHLVKSMIHEMQLQKIHAGVFVHPDLEELKHAFFKKFVLMQAGGGLVRNENAETLLMFRRGFWDLPKGKLDEGETMEECAVREVREETGLKDITLQQPLITTWHTYHQGTKFMLKESHWYHMTAKVHEPLTPQTEEGISEVKWVAANEIKSYYSKSFPSVVDVLEAGLAK